jgi:hypothetical protein
MSDDLLVLLQPLVDRVERERDVILEAGRAGRRLDRRDARHTVPVDVLAGEEVAGEPGVLCSIRARRLSTTVRPPSRARIQRGDGSTNRTSVRGTSKLKRPIGTWPKGPVPIVSDIGRSYPPLAAPAIDPARPRARVHAKSGTARHHRVSRCYHAPGDIMSRNE